MPPNSPHKPDFQVKFYLIESFWVENAFLLNLLGIWDIDDFKIVYSAKSGNNISPLGPFKYYVSRFLDFSDPPNSIYW